VAAEQRLAYKKELLAGDTIFVRSRVLEVRQKVILFMHEMVNAQTLEVAATSHYTTVHIDRGTRKSCPLPAHVQAVLRPMNGSLRLTRRSSFLSFSRQGAPEADPTSLARADIKKNQTLPPRP